MNSKNRGRMIMARDKHLLSLYKEYNKLENLQREAPLIELDEPYQRGWVRSFRLREDAQRREDRDTLLEILERVNVKQYCRKGTFMQKNRKTGKVVPIGHNPKRYSRKEWSRLDWKEEHRKYFDMRLVSEPNIKGEWVLNHRYVFIYPFYLESYIEKHFITHRRVATPEIDARLAEIDNFFDQVQALSRIYNIKGWTWHWRYEKDHKKRERDLAIKTGLEEYYDEQ